ncbi:DUF421 domain-containing protein [Bacillus taeanensis]|uniref:DUF421 domain-containing protein n=1 Tax=Bacillus taeanensis TaxID=273032 RepID=A0A366Y0E9_9BACI|nr:DUF421 domain-containing protein [Bacillus taeanensis]RBW71318.1 DUF421 domain-containing protein [Bacillus taeanensis]
MDFLGATTELVIGFLALLVMTKVLGKTQITQITPFDFISALILGELVGNGIYDKEVSVLIILYAIVLWGSMIYIVEMITQKFRGARAALEGKPSIVIRNGKVDREQLKNNKLDINQMQHLLRQKDIFSVREVEYAILETDGTISVLRKSKYENPTNEDLKIAEKPVYLPVTLISDGEIDYENLQKAGFNDTWLHKKLKEHKIDHPEEVLYAEWKEDEGLYLTKIKS